MKQQTTQKSQTCPFYIEVIKLFMKMYAKHKKGLHPIPSWRQREAVEEVVMNSRCLGYIEDLDDWEILFDRYFRTDFGSACDYHISHCFSGKILENRYFEALL